MKRFGMICSAFVLIACSHNQATDNQQVSAVPTTVPCSYSCNNTTIPCPYAENVQKPRVTEVMPKSRPCCDDKSPNTKEVIPDAPEIFVISANRTLRSMFNDRNVLFDRKTRVFVADTVNNEPDMPTGIEKGTEALKRGLGDNENIEIVSDRGQAQYIVTSEVSWYDTPTKTVPAIKYSLGLFDTRGQKLGEWNEILHQAKGDRSWW